MHISTLFATTVNIEKQKEKMYNQARTISKTKSLTLRFSRHYEWRSRKRSCERDAEKQKKMFIKNKFRLKEIQTMMKELIFKSYPQI